MFQDGLPEATALGAALLAWVGVSEDYLSRVFHKITGISPQAFRDSSSA